MNTENTNNDPFPWNLIRPPLLVPLIIYAVCGLVLALMAHLLTFLGIQLGGETLFFAFHFAIFPLFAAALVISTMTGGMSWQVIFSGCPAWMKYMTNGFMIYAIVNFAAFAIESLMSMEPSGKITDPWTGLVLWRGFSGHLMFFYSSALAMLVSAYRRQVSNAVQHCRNGHVVGFSDQHCPVCGGAIAQAAAPTVQ